MTSPRARLLGPRVLSPMVLRESRGSGWRLAFFVNCLAVGVAAIVAVAGHSAARDQAIRRESRTLLAADLAISSYRPLPAEVAADLAARADLELASLRELPTTVAVPPRAGTPGPSRLVEVKAIEGGYPFYGRLGLEPDRPLAELLDAGTVLVAPDLLGRLGLAVGDELALGGQSFTIAAVVTAEPDRLADAFTLGPRVFLSGDGLARTDLERFGSHVDYRTLVKMPDGSSAGALAGLAEQLRERLDEAVWSVETHADAQPGLRSGISRTGRFLGLVALLSLLLGGLGIAQTTRAWLAGRMDSIAVLRCLGMRPIEVLALYAGQTVLLGLAGSLAGAALGTAVQAAIPRLAADLLPVADLPLWQPAALARGIAAGVGVALLCSLPSLLAVRRVSPLRVLRRDVEPLPLPRPAALALGASLAAGIGLLAVTQAGALLWGALFVAGLAAATALLAGAAWALTRLAAPLQRAARGVVLRQGLAGLTRPGMGTLGAIVALGLGVLLVSGMTLVERGLTGALLAELPTAAPSAFLVDIQPDQWAGVQRVLAEAGAEEIDSVPVVTARLVAIDGVATAELAQGERGDRHWALTREQRLTYLERLPPDNEVVAGALWSDPARAEVSVEVEFAEDDLGANLGDVLTFDVQGVPIDLALTSLRRVDWRTFDINFFLVVEPGVLDEAPQIRLATARLPPGGDEAARDALAARYPNVTLVPIREVLSRIAGILSRLADGVRFLGSFTVVAGILILAGAVAAAAVRRAREIALLKTLGMIRRQVVALFAVEYGLIGLAAAAIGVAGGNLLAWAVLTYGMEIDWRFEPTVAAVGLAATGLLAAATGVAAGWRALTQPPLAVLQGE